MGGDQVGLQTCARQGMRITIHNKPSITMETATQPTTVLNSPTAGCRAGNSL